VTGLSKSLMVFLTVGVLCSGPSVGGRSNSGAPPRWWETGVFKEFHAQADELHRKNDYSGLEELYRKAEQYARQAGQQQARVSYLTALGNTYLILFRYREAIETYREATRLAEDSGNWEGAGAIAPGLASVYSLVGDYAAARQASAAGLEYIKRLPRPPYGAASLKLQFARLARGSGDFRPALAAIEAARAQTPETERRRAADRVETEAEGWSLLGEERLRSGDLDGAENALAEGMRLRLLFAPRNLCTSYLLLGELRLVQAEHDDARRKDLLREAERFTDQALKTMQAGRDLNAFGALHQRGMIRQRQGRPVEALGDFAAAADMANRWRLSVPPADSSLTGANVLLDQAVFRDFAEAAAARALATGEERWVRESFLATEQNRAVSLRQTRELVPVWRERLPDRYWAALAQIRKQESAHMIDGHPASHSERLNLELTEMEAAFGFTGTNIEENFQSRTALIHLQEVLGENEVLLSVQAGKGHSYLWAVTRNSLRIYELPGSEVIGEDIGQFRRALLERRPGARQLGASLYESVFGQLSAFESAKASWLLSLDGPFFELPFAALREAGLGDKTTERKPAYLIERHALQIVPGAFLLGKPAAIEATESTARQQTLMPNKLRRPSGGIGYVGFGDPVYNQADPRFQARPWYQQRGYGLWREPEISGQLNRLVASGAEVNSSALACR